MGGADSPSLGSSLLQAARRMSVTAGEGPVGQETRPRCETEDCCGAGGRLREKPWLVFAREAPFHQRPAPARPTQARKKRRPLVSPSPSQGPETAQDLRGYYVN